MSKSIVLNLLLAVIAVVALSAAADAASFATGDLVVSEVGDGTTALANTGNPMSLVEYTAAGSLVQSVAIPSTGPTGLEPSGSASSEGALCLSADGASLSFAGYYDVPVGNIVGLANATAAAAPRGYGSVNYAGTYTFGGTFGGFYSGNNVRGAATNNGTNFWGVGANSDGTILEPGNTVIQNLAPNGHVLYIDNGNLFMSSGKNGTSGIWEFSGLPTSAQAPTQIIVGNDGVQADPTSPNSGKNPYGFAISPGPIVTGSLMYVADGNTTVGVQKYTFDGTNWDWDYNLPESAGNLTGLAVNFTTDTLYAVNPTDLFTLDDTGAASNWTSLVHLTNADYAFRGLSFAPTAPVVVHNPGDANGDGQVDINDLTIVLAHYNQTGQTWSSGEFTGSGTVDINDLTIVLAHYNQTYGSSPVATPEPSSLALLAGAAGLVAFAIRRRARMSA